MNTAKSFLETAIMLEKKMEIHDKENIFFPIEAYVTLLSFALELYLKALLLDSQVKNTKRTHKLSELVNTLPNEVQTTLCQTYINYSSEKEILPNDLINKFKEIEHVFVQWRYIHEYTELEPEVNVKLLKSLVRTVASVAISKLNLE